MDPIIRPIGDWWNTKPPEPIIWRDPARAEKGDQVDAVLSTGEVALLSGAGNMGKSTFTRTVALAGATASDKYGTTCGLRVATGAVVLVSYEDSPARIADHLRRTVEEPPERLMVWPNPEPLWESEYGRARECDSWSRLWESVRDHHVRLVVIDPANVAFRVASPNDGGAVRAFLYALAREADEAQCGVLVVTHDTKASRDAARAGEDPGAGVVAGAAAWYDGSRGVLSLMHDPQRGDDRLLECVKANYGRTGWGARLCEISGSGDVFRGFDLVALMSREDLAEAKREPPNTKTDGRGSRIRGTVARTKPTPHDDVPPEDMASV